VTQRYESTARRSIRALALLLTPERRQAATLYTLLDQSYFLGERTRYLNAASPASARSREPRVT
jgi:hypothetical protein